MAASARAKLITKLHTELKKKYSVPPSQPSRPLLEHILYACLLQDAPYDLADEGLAKCEQEFTDWNEVRVTNLPDLAQVLSGLPDPGKAARRLKETLQAVFEEFYSFDLDFLKKENLGVAVGKFEAMPAFTPFVLAYTSQHGLGGHSIPIDYAAMVVMLSVGIASQDEAASGKVPGLERAIPKNKGTEFGALLHQAGVDLILDHSSKTARGLLDAVTKGASTAFDEWEKSKKDAMRRVKRRRRQEQKAEEAETAQSETEQVEAVQEAVETPEVKKESKAKASVSKSKAKASVSKTASSKKAARKPQPAAKATEAEPAKKKSVATKAAVKKASEKASVSKSAPTKKAAAKKTTKASSAAKSSTKKATKKAAAKKSSSSTTKKSTTKKSTTKKSTTKKAAKKSAKSSSAKSSSKKAAKASKRKPR
ncbi:hypothetical protein SV7mr_33640 [Stieleria bergensis]|uniref:Uncharacterized protein n=1 Tax=Stieleria bergensis TaxID=2528025 RepID=A0A517SXG9_9BACT|nr:hypothetical protein SV7mr_33640 [Planctomycetes bacterium SV_7m_r]